MFFAFIYLALTVLGITRLQKKTAAIFAGEKVLSVELPLKGMNTTVTDNGKDKLSQKILQ